MGVGDEVDPLWLLSGQMTLAISNYVLYPQYLFLHPSKSTSHIFMYTKWYLVTSDYIKHSFHNFSNVNWIRTRWSREKCWNFKWSLKTIKKKLDRNPNHYWPIQKNHNFSFSWNCNSWLNRVATSWNYAWFELKPFGCGPRRIHRMIQS